MHVFLEHRELGQDVGASEFLYTFLGTKKQETSSIVNEVAESILMKVREDTALRRHLASGESRSISAQLHWLSMNVSQKEASSSSLATAARPLTPTTGQGTA